ncbi:TetR/AcrR family transcriptional regulator (plasmid) [Asticcacaulis sp. DW145]|uniref:TetR/AcrR family transcriptional regulator n=1 Tax=Asticcacaulis currens TaxID=2984210 RepID=A0ABT5IEA2_9CAUL|nr:TetR/AcrR family transcriptional regulator [Asticcacaulis currens]MDC7694180.1 TetR/AcrR family transcriptional regulator [Asticcacaulis currens]BEV12940.1 TetR/AcrR family transcriptional regulator [Asticcacaulis sp. DW145]
MSDMPNLSKGRRGRPINADLIPQILKVAGDLFLELGYQGATMEAVAKGVGMSKLTLYRRFQTKEELFAAVVRAKCEEFIPEALFEQCDELPVREALLSIAIGLMNLMNSREAMSIETILRADGANHQNLRDLFFEAGPGRVKAAMARYFQRLSARGTLKIEDPVFYTHVFSSLIKGSDIHMRCGMGIGDRPSDEEIGHYCTKAVDFFVRGLEPPR